MPARPPVLDRKAVQVQVVGDEIGTRPPHVRRVGLKSFGDLRQLGSQLLLSRCLALLPLPGLVPDRTPPPPLTPGRVHRHPALQLNDRTIRGPVGCCGRGHDGSLRPRAARTVPVIRRGRVGELSTCCVVVRRVLRRAPSRWRVSAYAFTSLAHQRRQRRETWTGAGNPGRWVSS